MKEARPSLKSRLLDAFYRLYATVLGRPAFLRFHRVLFDLGLRGMGMINYQNDRLSGERFFLRRVVSRLESPVVVDVGANAGQYAEAVLAHVPSARIIAFEPHPKAFEHLEALANARGFQAFNLACGEERGTAELFDYAERAGSQHASMFRDVLVDLHHAEASAVTVPVVSLDEKAADLDLRRINLLKIDTEGYELQVIRGASRLLREGRIDMIQYEFNEMHAVSRVFARDFFQALGDYALFRLLPHGLLPLGTYEPVLHELFAFQNLLAVRRDRMSKLPLPGAS